MNDEQVIAIMASVIYTGASTIPADESIELACGIFLRTRVWLQKNSLNQQVVPES